jgi:hypothetical protein
MSPPGGDAAQTEPVSLTVEIGEVQKSRQRSRGAKRRVALDRYRTMQAINVNADVRREARDGTDVAGWRARCTCGWNRLEPDQVTARSSWGEHAKRFDNDRHTYVRALPELGERDHLPHPNVVERLSGDLEGLFDDRRVETAGSLTVPYRGSTAHYREDR